MARKPFPSSGPLPVPPVQRGHAARECFYGMRYFFRVKRWLFVLDFFESESALLAVAVEPDVPLDVTSVVVNGPQIASSAHLEVVAGQLCPSRRKDAPMELFDNHSIAFSQHSRPARVRHP